MIRPPHLGTQFVHSRRLFLFSPVVAPRNARPAFHFRSRRSLHSRSVWASWDGAGGESNAELARLDLNQLQTLLNSAIASENYTLAARIRDVLELAAGGGEAGGLPADWQALGILDWLAERAEHLGFRVPTEVQKRSTPVILDCDDIIVQSETGSGKTLAFVLPMLSCLAYPPELYPDDLMGPQAVVIVPTRELGVQVVMLIYKLFGGSVNQGIPGAGGNIFNYSGPRGLKVKGLLLEEELELVRSEGYLRGAHVVVGTPQLLGRAMMQGPEAAELMSHARVVAVDEVDLCFQEHPAEMELLLSAACRQAEKPTLAVVGATLGEDLAEELVARGWLRDPVRVAVGARMRVPSGLRHRYMVVNGGRKLAAMCRQIRQDLRAQGEDVAPARVIVFAASEEQAATLADPLRTVLWGDHTISVLLPHGTQPITALHSFRDNKATLLLATPAAARGLDLPAVSHVYNVGPAVDATDYLHRAGRAGRIGSSVPGLITSLVSPGEEEQHLLDIARELNLDLVEEPEPEPDLNLAREAVLREMDGEGGAASAAVASEDLERLRSGLEDLFNLY